MSWKLSACLPRLTALCLEVLRSFPACWLGALTEDPWELIDWSEDQAKGHPLAWWDERKPWHDQPHVMIAWDMKQRSWDGNMLHHVDSCCITLIALSFIHPFQHNLLVLVILLCYHCQMPGLFNPCCSHENCLFFWLLLTFHVLLKASPLFLAFKPQLIRYARCSLLL